MGSHSTSRPSGKLLNVLDVEHQGHELELQDFGRLFDYKLGVV